jgi:hypothetical protein
MYMQYQLLDYTCMCLFLSFPFLLIEPFLFEGKTISPWIRIYMQYELIDYTCISIFLFFFHFCLTYLTFCGVKHFCLKRNNYPIDWSNGPKSTWIWYK